MNRISHRQFFVFAASILVLVVFAACGDDPSGNEVTENSQNEFDECATNADCEDPEICVRDMPGDQGECRIPGDERADGESCTDSAQCQSGLCFDQVCTRECDGAADCAEADVGFAFECRPTQINDDEEVGLCNLYEPESCSSNDDCSDEQVCAFAVNADDDGLKTVCLPDNDGLETGEVCSDDRDCRSELCQNEMCAAPCVDEDHCSDEQICEDDSVSKAGHEGNFEICIADPVIPCTAPLHCDDEELTCNELAFDADDNLSGAMCGLTNPGETDLGESCTASADCESDFCWESEDGSTGECTVFCEESSRDCADEQVCTAMNAGLGACLGDCDRNEDCDGGNVCHLGMDPGGDHLTSYCDAILGESQTGDACSENVDCDNGLCLTVSTYEVTDQMCGNSECDSGYECRCPPDIPGCIAPVCVSVDPIDEASLCSKFCDIDNGDSDCAIGDHQMTQCTENVSVNLGNVTAETTVCSLENAE